ncbi:hypothetical protein BDP27DRAFT_1205216, partial [Rhodocollybia butyracea]
DLYLDELHQVLSDCIGVSVNESTIWKALCKKGFTMKKVPKRFWSMTNTDKQHSTFNLVKIVIHTTLYLLMKAPLINELQFATEHGHYVDIKLRENVSSFEAAGDLSSKGMVYAKVIEGSFMHCQFLVFLKGLLDQMDLDIDPGAYIIMDNA